MKTTEFEIEESLKEAITEIYKSYKNFDEEFEAKINLYKDGGVQAYFLNRELDIVISVYSDVEENSNYELAETYHTHNIYSFTLEELTDEFLYNTSVENTIESIIKDIVHSNNELIRKKDFENKKTQYNKLLDKYNEALRKKSPTRYTLQKKIYKLLSVDLNTKNLSPQQKNDFTYKKSEERIFSAGK